MRKIMLLLIWFAVGLAVMPALAATYVVDNAQSRVTFSGSHAGQPFSGTFGQWQAKIQFDPAALASSQIEVSFDLASAKTGNPTYDGALPTADWFDLAKTPTATFRSEKIVALANGTYQLFGQLTLRGKTLPLNFPFSLMPRAGAGQAGVMQASATLPINRLDYGIGQQSDPKAEWVSPTITVFFELVATPQP